MTGVASVVGLGVKIMGTFWVKDTLESPEVGKYRISLEKKKKDVIGGEGNNQG